MSCRNVFRPLLEWKIRNGVLFMFPFPIFIGHFLFGAVLSINIPWDVFDICILLSTKFPILVISKMLFIISPCFCIRGFLQIFFIFCMNKIFNSNRFGKTQ
ncbi:hypothetical protein [Crucivirus-538]|nr:hypothetical protein [Crucivirus-538]